ncbi:DUF397 domain-containing protein [Streptomyces mirabilis]|uniref:DUF397 domain-containing protein n=1 Tax=Streptomyces sp. NPDC005388 TaxID=3156717 RepID=UPI0033A29741
MHTLDWQKSTYSPDGSNCVYVATASVRTIYLRESDDPEVILSTTPAALSGLIRTLKTLQAPS